MKPLPELTASTVGPDTGLDTGSAASRAAPASPGVTTNIAGTARLVRLALRRDRAKLPIWLLGTTVLLAVSLSATREQYPTEADRLDVLRSAADSPALLLMRTAPTGAGTGALAMFQVLTPLAVLAGFMSTLAVVRHTRQNEETGRAEMIGATAVGRYAGLAAALGVAAGANLVLTALVALTLAGFGEPAAGSVAAGAAVGVTGLAFAAIAAVTAQVAQSARTANGIAATAIGAAFVVRGLGDALGRVGPSGYTVTSAWPSWLSPIGWATQVHPFAGDRWWVLAAPLMLTCAGVMTAFVLTAHRDVGMGMIAARPGPVRAAARLLSPLGLAWRLQRGTLLGRAAAVTVLGAGVGSLGGTVEDALADNEGAADTITSLSGGGGGDLIETFFAAMMALIGAMTAAFVIQVLLRPRTEETTGRAEVVLATATGRLRWFGGHLVIASAGAAGLLGLAGVSMGTVSGLVEGGLGGKITEQVAAAFGWLPPALVIGGLAVAVFGFAPRLTASLAWAGFTASLVLGQLGDLLNLPRTVRDLSPFSHVPALPATEATATPLVVLAAVAVALGTTGTILLRRRDVQA